MYPFVPRIRSYPLVPVEVSMEEQTADFDVQADGVRGVCATGEAVREGSNRGSENSRSSVRGSVHPGLKSRALAANLIARKRRRSRAPATRRRSSSRIHRWRRGRAKCRRTLRGHYERPALPPRRSPRGAGPRSGVAAKRRSAEESRLCAGPVDGSSGEEGGARDERRPSLAGVIPMLVVTWWRASGRE
jgi:hypothetical protein